MKVEESLAQKLNTRASANLSLILATVGLGFCLACTEYERYTALWTFNTRSVGELALILFALVLVLGFIAYRSFGGTIRFYQKKVLLIALAILQSVGLLGRFLQTIDVAVSPWLSILTAIAMQSAGILFILYAELFLEIGVKKAIRSFALAVMIAGILQIFVMAFSLIPAAILLFSFMPIATALLILADKQREKFAQEKEQEDIKAELADDKAFSRDFPFWEYCVSITLLTVLLLALHNQGMMLQDSGEASRAIQTAAGFGGIIAGILFLAILGYLQESEALELFRLLVLPLILVALYVSALFGGSGIVLYLVLLGICYAIVLLFVWTVPRYYRKWGSPFMHTCIAYFAYRLGWALGICGNMIIPAHYGDVFGTSVILASFFVLLGFSAMRLIKYRRNSAQRLKVAKEIGELSANTDIAFFEACKRVAESYTLTPREREVLVLLAKGRNAKYIAHTLVVSDGTARTHIMHIYQKMGISSQQTLMDCVDDELTSVSHQEV